MIDFRSIYGNLKGQAAHIGYQKAVSHLLYQIANKFFSVRRFDIIYLTPKHLAPLNPEKYTKITSRLATEEDLLRMQTEDKWNMTDTLIQGFRQGDKCLLSFVDGVLAGYTWVHTQGKPELMPGLKISIPNNYGYNFAGFTLPEFRGCGLQPYRHHEVLRRPEWNEKIGMIGYVDSTNWSSKKGQAKSGYQKLGALTLIGTKKSYKAIFSSELKKMGIRRI